jgi:hypothetical protein
MARQRFSDLNFSTAPGQTEILLPKEESMKAQHVPPNYTGVHYHQALGIPVEFCIQADVNNHPIDIVQNATGFSLKVQECNFRAIVEWIGLPKLTQSLYQPSRWWVGFVQNLTAGAIIFRYGANRVTAAVSPRELPCKDSGSAGTWYDPSPFSVKRFGITDEFAGEIPLLPQDHPARTDKNVRYIQMGDAPGTGKNIPLVVPVQSSRDPRAMVKSEYTIAWTDPLDPGINEQAKDKLAGIEGNLNFRTCLAVSSEADIAKIKTTTKFCYLYYVDWYVDYSMTVNNGVIAQRGRGGVILEQGLWKDGLENPIVTAPDANESVCVRFL